MVTRSSFRDKETRRSFSGFSYNAPRKPRVELKKRSASFLEHHPMASFFPLMGIDEFNRLVTSIKRDGLIEPITLFQDKILDGRNREEACRDAGVTPSYVELPDGEDPWTFVLAKNVHRRHLNKSQRALVAERLSTFRHGGDRKSSGHDQDPDLSLDRAARLLGVSRGQVDVARKLVKAESKLIDRVWAGELSLNAALTLHDAPVYTKDLTEDELEEIAEERRVTQRKARLPKRRKGPEEKHDGKVQSLLELAMKDSPRLERFRFALGRFETRQGTKSEAVGELLFLVKAHREHMERVELILNKYLRGGVTY